MSCLHPEIELRAKIRDAHQNQALFEVCGLALSARLRLSQRNANLRKAGEVSEDPFDNANVCICPLRDVFRRSVTKIGLK